MDLSILESLNWERKMDMEHICGLIIHNILVVGKITILKVKDNTFGPMAENTKEVGLKISFKDMVSILGLMAGNMKVIISLIEKMGKEHIHGHQARNFKVDGKMESNTVKLRSQMKKEGARKVFGEMEN